MRRFSKAPEIRRLAVGLSTGIFGGLLLRPDCTIRASSTGLNPRKCLKAASDQMYWENLDGGHCETIGELMQPPAPGGCKIATNTRSLRLSTFARASGSRLDSCEALSIASG